MSLKKIQQNKRQIEKSVVMQQNKKPLGIYIHIPFCIQKCNYCDFLSFSCTEEIKKAYMDALLLQIKSTSFPAFFYPATIYIGGGTPTCLKESYLVSIMQTIQKQWKLDHDKLSKMEITIEANPGTLTKDNLQVYRSIGINRISIGLQSANNKELQLLGRIHTFEQFLSNYEAVRMAGFENINIDIMSALPNQTLESYMDTLTKVIALQPEHISSYSLIIEEGTPFYKKYGKSNISTKDFPLPDEEVERAMYDETKKRLQKSHYEQYEISNYAKKGFESKHNSSYWQRTDYIGLGLGASSLIQNTRFCATNDLSYYIDHSTTNEIYKDIEVLTKQQQIEEFMFLGLRMIKGINKIKFQEEFGKSLEEVYSSVLKKLKSLHLLEECNEYLYLTKRGIEVSNFVLSEFLL